MTNNILTRKIIYDELLFFETNKRITFYAKIVYRITINKYAFFYDFDFSSYDKFNLQDYEPYDIKKWYDPRGYGITNPTPILTSRSCPNKCSFCAMNKVMGLACRMKSAKKAYEEIEYLYNEKNANYFHIEDNNFTLNKKRVLEICNLIVKNNLKIYLDTPNGLMVQTLDKEVVDALSEAGLIKVNLAIESGSEYIRNEVVRKHISMDKLFSTIDFIRNYKDIHIAAYFIVGFPEETEETLIDTYKLVERLDIDKIILMKLTPLPGTDLYDQCAKDNLFTKEIDLKTIWNSTGIITDSWAIKPYNIGLETLTEYYEILLELNKRKMQEAYLKYNRKLANSVF